MFKCFCVMLNKIFIFFILLLFSNCKLNQVTKTHGVQYLERKQDLPQCTGEVMLSAQSLHVTICHHRMASTFELGDDQVFKKNALKDNGRDLGKTELE